LNRSMAVATPDHSVETLRRRRHLSRTWAIIVVGWSAARTIIVWAAVGDYGLNPWVYLSIDLVSASTDAYSTPKMVLYFVDNRYRLAVRWAVISLVAFLIPDVYIFLGTHTLPHHLVAIIVGVIALTLLAAVIGVSRKVHQGRLERANASVNHPAAGVGLG